MSEIKTLHNSGARKIIVGEFVFKPNAIVEFPNDVADRLLALYQGEVVENVKVVEKFQPAIPVEDLAIAVEETKAVEDFAQEEIKETKKRK